MKAELGLTRDGRKVTEAMDEALPGAASRKAFHRALNQIYHT